MNSAFTSEGRPITSSINTNRSPAADAVAHTGTATVAITLFIGPAEARSLRFVVIHNNGSTTIAAAQSNGTAAVALTSLGPAAIAAVRSIQTGIALAA
jgi:hypothetical protein